VVLIPAWRLATAIAPYYSAHNKELLENHSRDNRNWPSATRLRNYSMPVLDARAKYVHDGGTKNSQIDAPLVAAFQMQADTIFIISDGHPTSTAPSSTKNSRNTKGQRLQPKNRWSKLVEKERQRMEKSNDESSPKYWKEIDEETPSEGAADCHQRSLGKAVHQALPSSRAGQDFLLRRRLTMFKHSRWRRQKEASKNYTVDYRGCAFLKALAQEFHGRYREFAV
jgi:hypothetical protein